MDAERVDTEMARLVAGEQQATWDLHALAEPARRAIVRAEARRVDLRLGEDDVVELTLDAAIDALEAQRSTCSSSA